MVVSENYISLGMLTILIKIQKVFDKEFFADSILHK